MGTHQHSVVQWRASPSQTATFPSPPGTMEEPFGLRPMTTRSQSDYEHSSTSGIESNSGNVQKFDDDKTRPRTPRWFTHVKEWLAVSEPSAQAMKDQKRTIYKKHGVDPNSPQAAAQAAAKMHVPIGQVPEGVVTSTRGPSPEKAYKQRMERQKKLRQTGAGQSTSSSISSVPSTKEVNPATPWE